MSMLNDKMTINSSEIAIQSFCNFIDGFARQGTYKMNVIQVMLNRGYEDWFHPLSADVIAKEYYDLVRKQSEEHSLKGIANIFQESFSQKEIERHLNSLPFKALTTESPRTGKSPFENANGKLIVREEYCIPTKQAHAAIQLAVENKLEDYFEMKQK
ncbi:hypothetical protein [Exiguobacterium sp. s37]|uniref:hypothetical protein n=1 Tax=Exiguobacterium sp. s37 TaxID=2751275 RepID=UPI001BE5E85B|nr:hypothetical protein [Exiguobacterium sp. s37]